MTIAFFSTSDAAAASESNRIYGTGGSDTLSGSTGDDILYGIGGNDSISGTEGTDTVYAGVGDDIVDYSIRGGAVVLYGNTGSDTLRGSTGDDIIYGGDAVMSPTDDADSIDGGGGDDLIYANGGNDTVTGSLGAGYDVVYAGVGNDTVTYSASNQAVVIYGNGGSDTLTGGSGNDTLYGGSAIADSVDNADSIDGGDGDDIIYANGGNDSITGTAGQDVVYAGIGNDTVDYGNSSYDVLIYGNVGMDVLTGGRGNDTIYGGDNAEDSRDGADSITAGAGADLVYAGSGSDTVIGAGVSTGASIIYGGQGNDSVDWSQVTGSHGVLIYGNEGSDSITFSATGALSSADTLYGGDFATDSSVDRDTLNFSTNGITVSNSDLTHIYGIEKVTFLSDAGSANSITLTNNFVTSSSSGGIVISQASTGLGTAALTVDASAVTRTTATVSVIGGAGADSFTGGAAKDIFYGGVGSDRMTFSLENISSNDTVYGGTASTDSNTETDTLYFTNNGTLASSIFANVSGIEAVSFLSDATANTITLTDAFVDASATNNVAISLRTTGGSGVLTANASLLLSGHTVNITGGAGADVLTGGAGADTITGGLGNDSINGGGGLDSLIGGGGEDQITLSIAALPVSGATIEGGSGADTLVFSDVGAINFSTNDRVSGIDTVTLSGNSSGTSYTITLSANLVSGAETGTLTVNDSNSTTGNRIDGSAGTAAESIQGGSGADTITGGSGNDRINAEAGGADSLNGGAGADNFFMNIAHFGSLNTLIGGIGTDTIYFGDTGSINFSANDVITGIDMVSLTGNSSGTSYRFTLSANLVSGAETGTFIFIDAYSTTGNIIDGSAGTAAESLVGGEGADSITGGSGNDSINAEAGGADSLEGGSGADSFIMSIEHFEGINTVIGGIGADTIEFQDKGDIDFSAHDIATGIDTLLLSGNDSFTSYTITLSANLVSGAETGVLTVNDSNSTTGNTIDGSAGTAAESIRGGSGGDAITGGSGNDSINAGIGGNYIIGGMGADQITLSGGFNVVAYTSAVVGGVSGDLAVNVIDVITGFGVATNDAILFQDSAVYGALRAGGAPAGAGGTLAKMAAAGTFTSGTAGAIEYYDNGTDVLITINVGGNTAYTSADDVTIKLAGITTGVGSIHGVTLAAGGSLSLDIFFGEA